MFSLIPLNIFRNILIKKKKSKVTIHANYELHSSDLNEIKSKDSTTGNAKNKLVSGISGELFFV